jgi:hypothetical protein
MSNGSPPLRATMVPLSHFPSWDRRIAGFPQKSIFHETAWLHYLEREQGGEAVVLRIVDPQGRERALWPGLTVTKGPIRIFGSPLRGWGTVSMGPLYHERDAEHIMPAAERALGQGGVHHWEFVSQTLGHPPPGRGYRFESSDTHRIPLGPYDDDMWKRLEQRCRTCVRKAWRSGLTTRVAVDGGFLGPLYELVAATFGRRKTTPPYDEARLKRLWETLFPLGKAFGIEVLHGSTLASAAVFIRDGTDVYAWSQASASPFNAMCPNNLLYWEAMRYSSRLSASYLHLPGAPGSSIGRFKESFNPEIFRFPFWIRDQSAVLRWGRRLYFEWQSALARWRYHSSRTAK